VGCLAAGVDVSDVDAREDGKFLVSGVFLVEWRDSGAVVFTFLFCRTDALWYGDWLPVPCDDGVAQGAPNLQAWEMTARKPWERGNNWQHLANIKTVELSKNLTFRISYRPNEASGIYGKWFKTVLSKSLQIWERDGELALFFFPQLLFDS